MSRLASRHALLFIGVVVFGLSVTTDVPAQPGYVPVLQNSPRLWQMPFGGVFPPVSGSALPVQQDPRRALIAGRTWHIADLSNPNLKEWARDHLKKDIEEIDRGKIQFTASSSCLPPGVPDLHGDGRAVHDRAGEGQGAADRRVRPGRAARLSERAAFAET